MIEIFNVLETYSKIHSLSENKIYSRLQGYINVELDYKGKIIKEPISQVFYNRFGKVFDSGECLLFPDNKCGSWIDFIQVQIKAEHEKELITGSICLVKRKYEDQWILAVYNQKVDTSYQAKVGKDYELFKYCISFENNKEYLGRESFPSWLIYNPENP